MSALRKGWCPGALRPMPAKDGLLVRLRITGGILPATTAMALASLAERCGNGQFDLTSRGNLQMRGIHERTLPSLHDGLIALGLLDGEAAGEAARNVIASPLAGLHDGIDIRPLTQALETRLVADTSLHALPAKFGFLIDDGSAPTLAAIAADVRFDWIAESSLFKIGLGGTRADAVEIGVCAADELVDRAAEIARTALPLFERHPDARRLCDFAEATLQEKFTCIRSEGSRAGARASRRDNRSTGAPATTLRRVSLPSCTGPDALSLAIPFGHLDAPMLRAAADVAASTPDRELRLTAWRAILVPGADETHVPGFIVDPADPRLRVAACVGVDGCDRATTHTREDALRLAAMLDDPKASDMPLHVSGCTKGCAKASPSPVTLVARGGRYDLVRDGRAGDEPVRTGLSIDEIHDLLSPAMERP